jgi:hypothetical protein
MQSTRFTARTRLVMLALAHGIDPMRAIDDTLATDFVSMLAAARARRLS